jgi:isocitrate dehydrogenase kinase/phosphatase
MATPPSVASAAAAADTDASASAIARTLLEGFDRHYALFRDCARAAKRHFEAGNWLAIGHVARDRIDFYDQRVTETVARIESGFAPAALSADALDALWASVKRHYIALLIDHKQPECAETFFNTVTCKILHRRYFNNRFIFLKPAIATAHIDSDPPSYRSYYPMQRGLRQALIDIVLDVGFEQRFADFRGDIVNLVRRLRRTLPRPFRLEANHQVQLLSSPFFRNRTAYLPGRIINGNQRHPFVVAIKHDAQGRLRVDALLTDPLELALLFSANRAYFLTDMDVPSAYVEFLHDLCADKTSAELYTMLGLQKHGKALFYRDLLHHLRHSTDHFVAAPGIPGLVMMVFTLPSFPWVFKVIRDDIAPSKDTDRARVQQKYMLVKHHDRAGRMTDILEYSNVAFPRARFSPELLAELRRSIPSMLEDDGDLVVIRHLYLERRLTPLNLHLFSERGAARDGAVREYGNAIRELAAVNIFCGDLLFKNFGVTRYGRVVFYDYDEIEYLKDCRFRRIPPPPPGHDEMSGDVWYDVAPLDVFPEEFATFLLTDGGIREPFLRYHRQLLDADWWKAMQATLQADAALPEVLSYPDDIRFVH